MSTLTATTFRRVLEELGKMSVERGRVSRSAVDEVFLMVAPWDPLDSPDKHLVTLGWGVPPKSDVQNLPCGLLSEDGSQVVSGHRTDRRGQFLVNLPQGALRLRFVSDVQKIQDVDILLRLGDDAAIKALEGLLQDDHVAANLKRHIRNGLAKRETPVSLPLRGPLQVPRIPVNLATAAHSGTTDSQRPGNGWQIDMRSRRLLFRLFAATTDVPYSVVLIELREGDAVIARRLLPLALDGNSYSNSLELRELLGDRPYTTSMQPVFWADLVNIRERVSHDEVEQILATQYVKHRPEVAAALRRLQYDLAQPAKKPQERQA